MSMYRYRECISACFAGLYGLDASGGEAVEEAVAKVTTSSYLWCYMHI